MEVILLERIEKLGQMGDVVNVKAGYARNYLLPRKKALHATDENRRLFETQRGRLEADNLKHRGESEAVAQKLNGLAVVLIRQAGEAGQLYGSVNARDLAAAVDAAGFAIRRQQVRLDRPIKVIGLYQVRIDLHPEVAVTVTANVARSPEEAEIQAKTGKAVLHVEEPARPEETEAAAGAAAAESPETPEAPVEPSPAGEELERKAGKKAGKRGG